MGGKKNFLSGTAVLLLLLSSCGGGGSNVSQVSEQTDQQIVVNPVIESSSGIALLKFKNAVLIEEPTRASYNRVVVAPHTGATNVQLEIRDVDNPYVYVYAKVNGVDLPNDPKFGIVDGSGTVETLTAHDLVNNEDITDTKFIKVSIDPETKTSILTFNYADSTGNSEGMTFNVNPFRLYNLVTQDNSNILDLGDYFESFVIEFNHLPIVEFTVSDNCPANKVEIDGQLVRLEIPPSKNCVALSFTNVDSKGFSPQFSVDNGTTWSDIDYSSPNDANVTIEPGNKFSSFSLQVKEALDDSGTIFDSVQRTINVEVYRDVNKVGASGLNIEVNDLNSGNTWNVSDGDSVVFVDPRDNTNAGTIRISGSSASYGRCNVYIKKDGTTVATVTDLPCSSIDATFTAPATDRGTGEHTLTFEVKKVYSTGTGTFEDTVDGVTVIYKVNQAPQIVTGGKG
ncbi:hypothetical protein CLV27_0086 [Phorcysia thermohydrogeniphila]|uniref:Uncharacterized protein n=2 Tax=Phorcysia thermohydrogeniphila TaxID=936138 RepID=A0A4R1GHQ1_9BACT|nr:hypothetical protein CLV27_0086 [Phorcysia thermohydrogeniphila]